MDLTRRTRLGHAILDGADRVPRPWRVLDRVAPGRRAKVILLAAVLGLTTLGIVTVSLVRWLNYATTARLAPWSNIDRPSAQIALAGMSRDEVTARFGFPARTEGDSWVYLTGRREGPALSGDMRDETVTLTFSLGRVSGVALSGRPSWGCMGPFNAIYSR